MANLVVFTFEDTEQAGKALKALDKVQSGGKIQIDDAAVVVKQQSGKVEVKNKLDMGIKWGALGGGILVTMLTGGVIPIAGLVIGAVAGGLVGKQFNMGIEKEFVQDVTEKLKPGTSALFLLGSAEDRSVVVQALKPFQGTVFYTTLPQEAVDVLVKAVEKKE